MPQVVTTNAVIENKIYTGWDNPAQDGLQINGNVHVQLQSSLFHRKNQDPTQADELLSVVNGGKLNAKHCTFAYSGKGILVGTGNTNDVDYKLGQYAVFEECIFDSLSRRSVMVNSGEVTLRRCLIRNWGINPYFYLKSYGSRAIGEFATVRLIDCIFEQEGFFSCIARGTFLWDMLNGGGFWLAAFDEKGGSVKAENCYKNRWWLTGANHNMADDEMEKLKQHLETVCPKLP